MLRLLKLVSFIQEYSTILSYSLDKVEIGRTSLKATRLDSAQGIPVKSRICTKSRFAVVRVPGYMPRLDAQPATRSSVLAFPECWTSAVGTKY